MSSGWGTSTVTFASSASSSERSASPGVESTSVSLAAETYATFVSMVPHLATAAVDIRLMPGQEKEEVLTAVQTTIDQVLATRKGLRVETAVTNHFPGAAIPKDHPLPQLAQRYSRQFTDGEWPIVGAGPGNEGYMLIGAGIPTLCGFGPTGGNAHAPDEWVDVASLTTTLATFAAIVCDYLPTDG